MKIKTTLAATVLILGIIPTLVMAQSPKKISKATAEKTALAEVKGGKVVNGEYEKEDGKHIWSFDVQQGDSIKEVWVDPISGKVLKVSSESVANEAKEK